ncbi:MAG: hypothetical protein WCO57_02575 [Verrucomicrobiota bacterium]
MDPTHHKTIRLATLNKLADGPIERGTHRMEREIRKAAEGITELPEQ